MTQLAPILSAISLLVAIAALGVSWRALHHSRRNADKALGDLPPMIEVFQPEDSRHGMSAPRLHIRITNYNRRAVHLHELDIETNEPFIAFRSSETDDDLAMAGIVEVYAGDGDGRMVFDPPLRLDGNTLLGSSPPQYLFEFTVTVRESLRGAWETQVGVTVGFAIDGKSQEAESRVVTVQRWAEEEFRARFRQVERVSDGK